MKHNILYSLSICIVFALTLFVISSHGRNSRSLSAHVAVIGEGVSDIVIVDNQKEVFPIWKERGAHGRVVVHFDIAMDTRPINEMNRKFSNGIFIGVEREDTVENENFMYHAMANGVVRQIIGVVPESVIKAANEDLRKSGYFKHGDHYRSLLGGIPKLVTSIEKMDIIDEPVLLDFDAKYFSRPDVMPEVVYKRLKDLRVKADIVTFSLSVGENEVTGEGIAKMKRTIELIKGI